MGRPVYPHEMCDPDFAWLVSNFRDNNPEYVPVESALLPVVLLSIDEVREEIDALAKLAEELLENE